MKFYTVIYVIIILIILLTDFFLYKKSEIRIFIDKIYFLIPTFFFLIAFSVIKIFAEQITDYRINIVLMWFNLLFIVFYSIRILRLGFLILPNSRLKQICQHKTFKTIFFFFGALILVWCTYITPFNPVVSPQKITFSNLPNEFRGYTIVQISDAHLGSKPFSKKYFAKITALINEQNADLVVFTGDMVNNFSEEMIGFDSIFNRIKAKDGKFAVLGNHDYGDYAVWQTPELKKQNFEKIKDGFAKFGFKLINNSSQTIMRKNSKIALIGVENFHKNTTKNYSDLIKATEKIDSETFKILLSHNPLHWDMEVYKKTNIDLTLSGHTHAGQMGIELWEKVISPAVVIYPKYNGIYQFNNQILYINRGIGYIGLPITFGINPQISVIKLEK